MLYHVVMIYLVCGALVFAAIVGRAGSTSALIDEIEKVLPNVRMSRWFWPVMILALIVTTLMWPKVFKQAYNEVKAARAKR